MNKDVSKYLTQQVMTATPAKLVYMLYDKAIASLREATAAIEAGNVEARWRANNRATEIVTHMWSTLDMENGGEIAENLDRLFSFILTLLTEVDLQNDPEPARKAITLLEPLRDSWRDLAMGQSRDAAAQTPAQSGAYGAQPVPMPTSISA